MHKACLWPTAEVHRAGHSPGHGTGEDSTPDRAKVKVSIGMAAG